MKGRLISRSFFVFASALVMKLASARRPLLLLVLQSEHSLISHPNL
jgi:hypothetical protein